MGFSDHTKTPPQGQRYQDLNEIVDMVRIADDQLGPLEGEVDGLNEGFAFRIAYSGSELEG
jgi:hypothetical protein